MNRESRPGVIWYGEGWFGLDVVSANSCAAFFENMSGHLWNHLSSGSSENGECGAGRRDREYSDGVTAAQWWLVRSR
jgi:hypothetical protein